MKNPSATKKGSGRRHAQGYSRKLEGIKAGNLRHNTIVQALLSSGRLEEAKALGGLR